METRFGTVSTWPGDLPHSLTSTTQANLLSSVLGSASKCHVAQPRLFKKRGKYALWVPPAQAPGNTSRYELQMLRLFERSHPQGASCLSTIFWRSFFLGNKKKRQIWTNSPCFCSRCLWEMVYFDHLPRGIAASPVVCYSDIVCISTESQEKRRKEVALVCPREIPKSTF